MMDPENEESGFVEQSERLDSERLDSGLPGSIAGQYMHTINPHSIFSRTVFH